MSLGRFFGRSGPPVRVLTSCACGHGPGAHLFDEDFVRGPCVGLDSYGIRCTCPAFLPFDDD